MNADPDDDSGSIPATDSWLEVLGVHILRGKPGGGSGGNAQGGATPGACATPNATATDLFFDYNLPDLTASDKQSLDAYAKAYLDANSSEKIVVDGYASVDGDKETGKEKNWILSLDRAVTAARYLIKQGVPKDKVEYIAQGQTDSFSTSNLCLNRRATIKPPPPPPVKKKTPTLGEKAEETDIFTVPLPEAPPEGIPRAQAERVLKDCFEKLAPLQRGKMGGDGTKVKVSPKVQTAGKVVSEGLDEHQKNISNLLTGNKQEYEPGVLAKLIAGLLPETIPARNFNALLGLRCVEAPEEKSELDHVRDSLGELADQVLSDFGVPKKYREKIKKFARDKTCDLIAKLPDVDTTVKDAMKKACEKLTKK